MHPVPPRLDSVEVAIANGTALSAAINLGGRVLVGMLMSSAWTAAGVTFQASIDGVTFADLFTIDGDELLATVAASQFIVLNPANFSGIAFLKVRSGTTGTPVNQAAARTLVLAIRAID